MTDKPEKLAEQIASGKPLSDSARENPEAQGFRELDAIARAFRSTSADPQSEDSYLFQWKHLKVHSVIGEGGFGIVYRAWDPILKRSVALKLCREDGSDASNDWIILEARRMARIRHPNVLAVHGADRDGDRAGIWSDLIRGESLRELLHRRQRLSGPEFLPLALDITEAVQAVHAGGLRHGDIKPANVMLREDGESILMDFGATSDGRGSPTFGSPIAMAPELFTGASVSEASDVYSLGALFYRVLTGRFPQEADSIEKLSKLHETHTRIDYSNLPSEYHTAVRQCLNVNPEDRPSAAQLLGALQYLSAAPERRRRHLAVGMIVGSLIVALAATGIGLWRSSQARDAEEQQRLRAEQSTQTLLTLLQSPRPSRSGRNLKVLTLLNDIEPRLSEVLPPAPEARASLLVELADTFLYFDEFDTVLKLADQAAETCAHCSPAVLADITVRQLHLRNEVAQIRRQLDQAESYARQAFALAEQHFSPDNPRRILALARVGDTLVAQRKLDKAEPFLRSALASAEKIQWPDPQPLAFIKGTWLTMLIGRSDFAAAETFAREYVSWADATFGLRHYNTLTAHQGLNRILIQSSQIAEAETRLHADIQTATTWLGGADATTLGLRLQMASLINEQDRLSEATSVLEQIRNDILSSDEPDQEALMVASGNLASRYKEGGRGEEAKALYEWVIGRAIQTLGENHPRVFLNQGNLAELYLKEHDYARAIEIAADIERRATLAVGELHVTTNFARLIHGRSLVAMDQFDSGIQKLEQAARGLSQKMGENAAFAMRARYHFAIGLTAAGQRDHAIAEVEDLLPTMLQSLGSDHSYMKELIALRQQLGLEDSPTIGQ